MFGTVPSEKFENFRSVMSLLSFVILVACLSSCATRGKPAIPQKTMSLRIESVPSGAEVYSSKNGAAGSRLGTTPLDIPVGASLDFDGSNYFVWFYSPDDCVEGKKIDLGEGGGEYELRLNCRLSAEGHDPKYVANEFVTRCSVRYGLRFHDQAVTLSFTLDPST